MSQDPRRFTQRDLTTTDLRADVHRFDPANSGARLPGRGPFCVEV
jgi:hypothetical protein